MTTGDEHLLSVLADAPRPIEVLGDGELGDRLRLLLGTSTGDRPATVVETTGTAAGIARAFERARDLGTVYLVAPAEQPLPLDLHDEVHVRGLTVVGVELS